MIDRTGLDRRRASRVVGVMLASLALAAACSSVSSPAIPSNLPTSLPSNLPSLGTSSAGTACLDVNTMAILTQLQASGADVQAILAQNKDALISGLQSFQPTDPTTMTWRDDLVTALQSGDMAAAAAKVQELTTAGITLATCP
jgi:hypothetical protein